jgi:hypothetical protein
LSQFNYLSVLISIIIGLAIAQILTGLGRLIQARTRVAFYWPSAAWAVLLLAVCVQSWWSLFRLRADADWTFFAFLVVVSHPVGLFLVCSLVLPDPGEFAGPRPVDLKANYFDHRRWFFGLMIAVSAARLLRPVVVADQPLTALDIGAQLTIMFAAAVAAITRRDWLHKALPVVAIVGMSGYYALVYLRLG